ncbi:MAG: hypothetical protein ACKV22_20565 [Bryobacteraceae bacterium]
MEPSRETNDPHRRFWEIVIFLAGALLIAGSQWPLLIIPNRIEPMVFGLPFFIFWMLALNLMVFALLAFAYWKLG